MTWIHSLLGKLGHINGNIVHRDLAELRNAASVMKSELSVMRSEQSAMRSELSVMKSELSVMRSEQSAIESSVNKLAIHEVEDACDRFHILYYNTAERTWGNTYWLGARLEKYPTDLWIYQEILYEVRPDVIIESGTFLGGSALFLASMCDLLNHGRVITIDVQPQADRPKHSRISYLTGSSVKASIVERVKAEVRDAKKVLVILDSDHRQSHVLAELLAYGPLVSLGSYLVVEDTNVNGHPVYPDHGPGPMEAVREFLKSHPEFVVDASREKFYITANPMGYLKKVSADSSEAQPGIGSGRD